MKKKTLLTVLSIFCLAILFAQPKLKPEQKLKDSIEFAKFRNDHPELFNLKRLPAKLVDGSFMITGFKSKIQILNNHVIDSVNHNFHPGMPDTTTVTPYNDIKISDERIKIIILFGMIISPSNLMINGYDSLINRSKIRNNTIDSKKIINLMDFNNYDYSIRISINGKIINNWKKVNTFKNELYKIGSVERTPTYAEPLDFFVHINGWAICDTTININDQLLIEVKNNKNNWMIDRYNFTRIAVSPKVSAIQFPQNKDAKNDAVESNLLVQKKTLIYPQK